MKKGWSIDFAGILANEEDAVKKSVFVNAQNTLQFRIKVISTPPENFPREVKVVMCFADEIGFNDDLTLNMEEREYRLSEYLERYILFFNIEIKGELNVYVARNVVMERKAENFKRKIYLNQIPIFIGNTEEVSRETFEEHLINNRFVGDNKNISKDEDDTPELICWSNNTEEYYIYGPFENHDHAYGGFRFQTSNSSNVHRWNLDNASLYECYIKRNILYVPYNVYYDFSERVSREGQELKLESTELNQNQFINENNNERIENKEDIEVNFLSNFINKCEEKSLYYDTKDLYNFHTAMKTGNLLILAGMSGTGKSKLVQCYADALNLSKGQQLFIPVRPYWQDDADVIGYLDTLNNIYRPGDSGLVNLLIHAYNHPEKMHVVCFDEMNIARVEHYFSQFLSVLEMDENKRILRLYNDEYQNKIYNNNQYEPTLKIGSNVLFVGTVNLDESTYQFSDKVLDRANVINLNVLSYENIQEFKVAGNDNKSQINSEVSSTNYATFRSKEKEISLTSEESKCLWEIHQELQKINRNTGIGWRIIKQISSFLNNLPNGSKLSRKEAFDLQLIQRVMTKIRGTEEQYKELLGVYDFEKKCTTNSRLIEILNAIDDNDFNQTIRLIDEKSKELRLYGHTI